MPALMPTLRSELLRTLSRLQCPALTVLAAPSPTHTSAAPVALEFSASGQSTITTHVAAYRRGYTS